MESQNRIILYHGGEREMRICDIEFPGPRNDCDFGAGFYLTPDRNVAEESTTNRLKSVAWKSAKAD